jgi:hypothetical protein
VNVVQKVTMFSPNPDVADPNADAAPRSCPDCHSRVSEFARFCGLCNCDLDGPPEQPIHKSGRLSRRRRRGTKSVVAFVAVAAVALGGAYALKPSLLSDVTHDNSSYAYKLGYGGGQQLWTGVSLFASKSEAKAECTDMGDQNSDGVEWTAQQTSEFIRGCKDGIADS